MATFTQKQNQELMAQAKQVMSGISEGKTTRDILANLYVQNLEDKTIQQGQVMADVILDAVKGFDADYQEAKEDLDGYIKKFQAKVDEGKSCVERCNYWLQLAAVVTAASEAMSQGPADRQTLLQETESLSVSKEEANEALEKELREKAREALKNSGILLTGLMTQENALQQMENANEAAGLLIDLGNEEIEYRAIIAMLAYTQVKTGKMENIPVDMTASQIAALVCAQVEQERILEGVGNGSIAIDLATALLQILGTVVLTIAAITVIPAVTVGAGTFFWLVGGALLGIPAMLISIAFIAKAFDYAMNAWDEESIKIVKAVSIPVKWVLRGIRILVEYVKENVLPVILEKGKQLLQMLCRRFKKPTMATSEESAVKEENEEVIVAEHDGFHTAVEPKLEPITLG